MYNLIFHAEGAVMIRSPGPVELAITNGGFYVCTPAWSNMKPTRTTEHRVWFGMRGEAEAIVDGVPFRLVAGRVYLIPAHHMLQHRCENRYEVYWLHFQPASLFIDLLLGQLQQLKEWKLSRWEQWREVYTQLDVLVRDHPPALALRVQAMMLCMCTAAIEEGLPGGFESLGAGAMELWPAIEFMDEHFKRNPPLSQIAKIAHLSPVYFHRRFSEAFHVTPHTYMLRKRMSLAQELLFNTRLSVLQVAEQCGYDSAFYFSRAFKKMYGQSPLQVRKRGTRV